MVTKKNLAIKLSKLAAFDQSDIHLEQYPTNSDIASDVLWNAYTQGNINDKKIADLGCGNGIFGIGALLLGAKHVAFYDIDPKAIEVTKKNVDSLGLLQNCSLEVTAIDKINSDVDTVFQNPPFGVQKRHADKPFLEKAIQISQSIYSIHKIESKRFIEKLASQNNFEVVQILQYSMPIKPMYKFHKQRIHYVKVGCFVLNKKL